MLPRTRVYHRRRDVLYLSRWIRRGKRAHLRLPPTLRSSLWRLSVSKYQYTLQKSQNSPEAYRLQDHRRLVSLTDFVPLSTHLQTRAMARKADYMLQYTPLRVAHQTSPHNTHTNIIPTCRIGQLSAGSRTLRPHQTSRLSAATRQIQLLMRARQSRQRPRGAPPKISKGASLTTPMGLWST